MTRKQVSDLLPLFILIVALAYSILYFNFRFDHLPFEHLAGLVLTLFTTLTYFVWKKGFKTILGITLILGTTNLVKFSPLYVTFGGGLSLSGPGDGLFIAVQLFSFLVLLLFAYINRQRIKQIAGNLLNEPPLTEAQVIEKREKKIERFKVQFKDRSIAEITAISRSTTYDKEAVEAANRLLTEKNT